MDPIRNPYAPGAGQRPPELAGRDEQLDAFDVVLERVARGRPERSLVLTGLRGVGKTVLLNALRSAAVRAGWGTGKLEARPDQSLRRPLASAVHQAVRELGPAGGAGDHVLGVVKAFAQREPARGTRPRRGEGCATAGTPASTSPAVTGRADSGDIEIDLVELLGDLGGLAADTGRGVAIFIDEMQDLGPDDVSALCAACHEICAVAACRSSSSAPGCRTCPRCCRRRSRTPRGCSATRGSTGSTARPPTRPSSCPPRTRTPAFTAEALDAMYAATGGYPYFIQAYGKAVWDVAPASPITAADVAVAAPEAESELAVGFFGSRYERATPGEREYLRAMADVAVDARGATRMPCPTADVAAHLGRKPQSLSPARDALLKKGLIYSGERGRIAFTVPHFGRYLRDHA